MPLETNPNTIADLDPTWPVSGDSTTDGDDHLRNLKRILQITFPNGTGGNGFNEPVLATVTELNYLQGVTSNVQNQIDSLNGGASAGKLFLAAPDGAKLLWGLTTAPAGWAFTENFTSLSVVASPSSLAGTTQGSDSALEWSHSHSVQPFTLSTGNIPPHSHAIRSSQVTQPGGMFIWSTDNFDQRIPTRGGSDPNVGETELNSISASAITNVITYESSYKPKIYHMAEITRDSDLDV